MAVIFICLKIASRFCLFHSIMFFFFASISSSSSLFLEIIYRNYTHYRFIISWLFFFWFFITVCIFFSYNDTGQTIQTCRMCKCYTHQNESWQRFAILAIHDLQILNVTTNNWRNYNFSPQTKILSPTHT